MPVIVEDNKTVFTATTVHVPTGRHDPLLLNFATAYNWTSTPPTRSAPSGGGSTWVAAGSRTFTFTTVIGEGTRYISMCVYAFRSVPTSTGNVSITLGGASGEEGQRDHFYSLSNASYHDYEEVGPLDSLSMGDDMVIPKQGCALFGAAISALKDSFVVGLTPLYNTTIDDNGGPEHPDFSTRAYTVSSRNRHRGSVGPGGRFSRNHIRWDPSTTVTTAGVYVGVDTIECNL